MLLANFQHTLHSKKDDDTTAQRLIDHFCSLDRVVPLVTWLVNRQTDENFSNSSLSERALYGLVHTDLTLKFMQSVTDSFVKRKEEMVSAMDDVPVNVRRVLLTFHQSLKKKEDEKVILPVVAIFFVEKIILPFVHHPDHKHLIGQWSETLRHVIKDKSNDKQLKDTIRKWFTLMIDQRQIDMYERLIACSSVQNGPTTEEDRKFLEWMSQLCVPSTIPNTEERARLQQELIEKLDCKRWKVMEHREEDSYSFYSRKEAGISGAMKIVTKIQLPLKEAADMWLSNIWKDDSMLKVFETRPTDEGLLFVKVCLRFPIPFSDRLYSSYIDEHWSDKKLVRVGWNAPHAPLKNHVVGHTYLHGDVFEEVEPNVTLVTMMIHVSTGGNFPGWLETASLKLQCAKFRKVSQRINKEIRKTRDNSS
ncbi:hypothetical protein PROFUN_10599 [Planoprotostelium fungivorum]|uniref:START domain-containing protein n=1 Tax=Planoprotostelium fungivorum TaxID=1890364 RepID=A0A2P6ND32_9EUKA|nr:hypothetical protein PROFUN_10599 [Planoprotostelium fungivorum]